MRITNIHERVVATDATTLGRLLARLGQPDDVLYPPGWDPMTLDGPVALGASGSHGTITAYRPEQVLEFTFPPATGVVGTHTFTLTPADHGTLLRHVVAAHTRPMTWLGWRFAIQPAHDAVLELLLDRAQSATGTPPARPHRLTPLARLLRRLERPRAAAVPLPDSALLAAALPRIDYADAYAVARRRVLTADPQIWADAVFRDPPGWVLALLGLRALVVGLVGIDRGSPATFGTRARRDDEVLLGEDAGHLDFRASVRTEPDRVVLSTVVALHDRRGRAYFAVVRLLHPFVVRAMLTRAAAAVARRDRPRPSRGPVHGSAGQLR